MDPYLGEIRMFSGIKPPMNWKFCDGSLLTIRDNEALYALIGTQYGGDGRTTFALPDLRGRLPVGTTPAVVAPLQFAYPLGAQGGAEVVTLTQAEIPIHTHTFYAVNSPSTLTAPNNAVTFGKASQGTNYALPPTSGTLALQTLSPSAVSADGGYSPHPNMMPTMTVNYIIAVVGLYPDINH